MASPNQRLVQPATTSDFVLNIGVEDSLSQAAVSTALVSVFRGKFCDAILPNRKRVTFRKEEIIYDVGDKERTFFFLQDGFVKVGTITPDGHELIYDVRKGATSSANYAHLRRAALIVPWRWSKQTLFPCHTRT